MLHQEIEIIEGKTLSYVKLNDWCEKVVLFFHDFMGLKEYFPTTGNAKRCLLSFDRSGWGVIYHFLLYYGTTSSKK